MACKDKSFSLTIIVPLFQWGGCQYMSFSVVVFVVVVVVVCAMVITIQAECQSRFVTLLLKMRG